MPSRYVIRFDDICPTMNWPMWQRVERTLARHDIRPIVAVVPDNRDPKLRVASARADFWSVVRDWQSRGWTIGWHGYQHDYCNANAGLVGIHRGSEFAGLDEASQHAKLDAARETFRRNGIDPTIWVAPGHSFDAVTIRVLAEFGIRIISDGFYLRVVRDGPCVWIPQQLWRLRRMPFGVWTVCLHINSWTDRDVVNFESAVERFSRQIVDVGLLLRERVPAKTALDAAFSQAYRQLVLSRRAAAH